MSKEKNRGINEFLNDTQEIKVSKNKIPKESINLESLGINIKNKSKQISFTLDGELRLKIDQLHKLINKELPKGQTISYSELLNKIITKGMRGL